MATMQRQALLEKAEAEKLATSQNAKADQHILNLVLPWWKLSEKFVLLGNFYSVVSSKPKIQGWVFFQHEVGSL
ncbi:hypothetical protein ACS0TY_000581 [Phlomoides rotata]